MALSGPEMLLKSLLGIEPKQMEATINNLIRQVNEIHSYMIEIRGRLDAIEKRLDIERQTNLDMRQLTSKGAANG